ncbi:hypothetical protein FAM09_26790 [Niastella caeni]|uniref:Glycosyltransferase RgtA/B/C/D-like domain-containing protein n=1 Tax=Niastella caeni TaxID=2569763 RepID=A0A4S8HC98_9BACT|nr:glycosyltransferase 87 family protein [Niastella caeni]THU32403.1 hypothetical protein FAM09_26790 [Niastella caeni]
MTSNKALLITVCCFLIALCLVCYKSLSWERSGAPDLRNRIVGGRLQKDDVSPYFYRWKPGDPVRYYDGANIGHSGVSNITASPFFHTLLYPLLEFQQRNIARIWLALEYLFILITGFIAYRLTKNNTQKIIVITFFTLFLLTEAWKTHVLTGQVYIVYSLLAITVYYCLTRTNKLMAAFIAGLAAIVLMLIRPNMVVFFFPFLFLVKNYSRQYLATLFIPVILLPAIYFSFDNNRTYWKDYLSAIQASAKVHQIAPLGGWALPVNGDTARLKKVEGWDVDEIMKHEKETNLVMYSENGNVFVLFDYVFKKRLSINMMGLLSGLSVVILLALYLLARKKFDIITLPNIALFGYCLYMVTDLFSPIWRHQYYGTQWLFPLLIAATVYKPANKWFYAGLLTGLLLNVVNTDYIKMEHTLGEYLILVVLLGLSMTRRLEVAGQAFGQTTKK